LLLSGEYVEKKKKRCKITCSKIGAEGSKFTPNETVVSRGGGNTPALWSLTLETPTTRPYRL